MEFTTRLELQSQATRLVENTSWTARTQITNGILTLSDAVFQRTYTCDDTGRCFDRLQFSEEIDNLHCPRFSRPY